MVGSRWERYCMDHVVEHTYLYRDDMPFNLRRIHPYKQKEVCEIYELLKSLGVTKAYIFGSASNMKCTDESDTDIAIDCPDDYKLRNKIALGLSKICPNGFDIIWIDMVRRGSEMNGSIARGVKIL